MLVHIVIVRVCEAVDLVAIIYGNHLQKVKHLYRICILPLIYYLYKEIVIRDMAFLSVVSPKAYFVGTFFGVPVFDNFSGTSQLSSGDASDSICPKGWGMGRFEDDRSYYDLFRIIYSFNIANVEFKRKQEYIEYKNTIRIDEIALQNNFIRSGFYNLPTADVGGRDRQGMIWESRAIYERGIYRAYYIDLYDVFLNTQRSLDKGYGFSVRWGGK